MRSSTNGTATLAEEGLHSNTFLSRADKSALITSFSCFEVPAMSSFCGVQLPPSDDPLYKQGNSMGFVRTGISSSLNSLGLWCRFQKRPARSQHQIWMGFRSRHQEKTRGRVWELSESHGARAKSSVTASSPTSYKTVTWTKLLARTSALTYSMTALIFFKVSHVSLHQ